MADKDTVAKRRGGLNKALVLPLPDGTIAQGDRQHKSLKYPGILSTAPVITYPRVATWSNDEVTSRYAALTEQ